MTHSPVLALNWFDFLIVGIVLLSTFISLLRGFVREAVSLLVWGAGIYLGFRYAIPLATVIPPLIQMPALQYITAFVIIFAAVWLVGLLIHLALRPVVATMGMGFPDRLLGLCFGFIRGLLVVAVLLLFVKVTPYEQTSAVQMSHLAPKFNVAVNWLDHFAMSFRR